MNLPAPHLVSHRGHTGTVRPRINLQITRDSRGQVRVVQPGKDDVPIVPISAPRNAPLLWPKDSKLVKIYKTRWQDTKRRKWYHSHTIIWRDHRGRRREKRSSLESAKSRAEEIAIDIVNGNGRLLEFTHADRASLDRARELLRPVGSPAVELVAGIYTQCVQNLLAAGRSAADLPDAIKVYLEHQPKGLAAKNIPDLVDELLTRRHMSDKWRRNLKKMLERFSAHFTGPLHVLQSREIDDWLDSLKGGRGRAETAPVGLRTRRNYRDAIEGLVNYAKERGHLSKSWDVIASVSDPEPAPVDVILYTPEELLYLLGVCERTKAGQKIVPLVCITAFAGVRHGEMNEEKARLLDWADIDFESKSIYVQKGASKTGRDRAVDMPDNLIAWLKPYAQAEGKICELENSADALCRQRNKAAREALREAEACASSYAPKLRAIAKGLTGPKKNALRKSFISYHNALHRKIDETADQAGNSASIIRKNYKRTDSRMKKQAERWFLLMPQRADVLPLFNWNR